MQLSALTVVLCRARRRRSTPGKITQPKRHLSNAYEILVTQYDQFSMGCVTFECRFQREGVSPTNHRCKISRVITLSCGIRISAVHHLVLSQYTHLTDRRTDRQNCESNTVHCIRCSRTVKTVAETYIIHWRHQTKNLTRIHRNKTLTVTCSSANTFRALGQPWVSMWKDVFFRHQ